MRRNIFFRPLGLFLLMAGMLVAGCSDGDDVVEVTTTDRPWVMEEEFEQNPSLRATPDQIIILHLEPALQGDRTSIRRNTIPYLVRDIDRDPLSFCIPAEEPHIVALELETSSGKTVMRTERGKGCDPVALAAGQYRMHLFHDGSAIAPPGKKAFLRRTNQIRLTGSSKSSIGSSEYTTPDWDFFTFTYYDYYNDMTLFVGFNARRPGIIALREDMSTGNFLPVFLPRNLGITNKDCIAESTSIALFTDPPNAGMAVYRTNPGDPDWNYLVSNYVPPNSASVQPIPPDPTSVKNACDDSKSGFGPGCVANLAIKDLGDYKFNLEFSDDCLKGFTTFLPIYVDDDDHYILKVQGPTQTQEWFAEFLINYKGYFCDGKDACTSSDLNLQEGEVAIFAECKYKPPAVVFAADVEDFNVYNLAPTDADGNVLGIKPGAAASVMVGPNTLVVLSSGGTVVGINEDTACLSGTPVAAKVMQMRIVSPKTYILDTGGCDNCNLTGVDLSGFDMSNKSFVNAIFSGANLTNALFNAAVLKDADFSGSGTQLTGTNFSSATLECTNFSSTVLTDAIFGTNTFTKDFSCRLNLTGATVNAKAFPFKNWRYFDLTNATIINNTGTTPLTLSSVTNSLNLSGAILNYVQGLSGAILDGADMGCAIDSTGSKICTQARQIDLSKASLKQATLKYANLRGANLNSANLEGADLFAAQLLRPANGQGGAASLSGAYLKNANLESAELSGVDLSNANFYGTKATAVGANMSNADFTGAYLSGADFSKAKLTGAKFTGAVLVGTSFNGATVGADLTTGVRTTFKGAFLQGTDFTDVIAISTIFESAYVDLTGTGNLTFQIPKNNLEFTGYWNNNPECVEVSYNSSTTLPESTNTTTTCPDGEPGSCTTTQWESPVTPIDQAQPPSSSDFPTTPAGECTSMSQLDFTNWYP